MAFATIGWRYYLLFVSQSVICVLLLWKYCPEVSVTISFDLMLASELTGTQTKGLSLEEINGLFGDEVVTQLVGIECNAVVVKEEIGSKVT